MLLTIPLVQLLRIRKIAVETHERQPPPFDTGRAILGAAARGAAWQLDSWGPVDLVGWPYKQEIPDVDLLGEEAGTQQALEMVLWHGG